MPRVRTTNQPWKVIEVSDRTFIDMKRQGRVLEVVQEVPETNQEATRATKRTKKVSLSDSAPEEGAEHEENE